MGARRRSPRWPAPRGATALVVALMLVVLVLFLGLVLDVGHLLSVRGELQNASDAAALAGAKELDGTLAQLAPAKAAGDDFAQRHATDADTAVVPAAVELGHWTSPGIACSKYGGVESGQTRTSGSWAGWKFCRIDGRNDTAALDINAVRVESARASRAPGGGAAPVFLGGVIGKATAEVDSEAVAVTGGPCTQECLKTPFAIRSACLYDDAGAARLACNATYFVAEASDGVDTVGFTTLVEAGPGGGDEVSTSTICAFLDRDETACTYVRAGTPINVNNGNKPNATCSGVKMCELLKKYVGKELTIPVIEGPCDDQYTGTNVVGGFAAFFMKAAYCKDDPGAAESCSAFASGHCAVLEFRCNVNDDEDAPAGCGWFGMSTLHPQLVR